MTAYIPYRADDGHLRIEVPLRGFDLMREPLLNKGSAFTIEERRHFGLEGLLPSQSHKLEQQARKVYAQIGRRPSPLDKYVAVMALQNRNEQLFYRVLVDHLEELMPIVYTPTVGEASRRFSQVFQRGRGIWITPDHRGRIAEILRVGAGHHDVRLIVATDNESILGIGDQGAGGMAISVGKLALYSAAAGIHPSHTLPVSLDVGTNNAALLESDMYLGWPHPRITGDAYEAILDEFAMAVRQVFPTALLQWEDFRKDTALHILDRHRRELPSFNDDIQGTGAVALAGLLTACRVAGRPLEEQRIVVHGAGAAGLGIFRQIRSELASRDVQGDALTRAIVATDSRGMLVDDQHFRQAYKRELAWPLAMAARSGLADPAARHLDEIVAAYRPTILIGTSGQAGTFTEDIVRAMAKYAERPIIFPFSNPTDHAEASPSNLYRWTEGRCLVATGSPFDPVQFADRDYRVGQGNNVFIFPGLGLGSLVAHATEVTDGMISAAAKALASMVTNEETSEGLMYPSIARLREAARGVAIAVVLAAIDDGVARNISADQAAARVDKMRWEPKYAEYIPV